jgi:hypothetical protein
VVHLHSRAAAGLVLVCLTWTSAHAQAPATPPPADLDAFMEEVLDRRDVNRAALQQYILDEQERFAVLGPARTALFGRHREFAWYVRDGLHVRSPVTVDGVTLDAEAREAYEREWMDEERQRLERRAKRAEERGDAPTLPEKNHFLKSACVEKNFGCSLSKTFIPINLVALK